MCCGGSTALFIFGYCFYYYSARSDMSGFMQVRTGRRPILQGAGSRGGFSSLLKPSLGLVRAAPFMAQAAQFVRC